MNGFEADIPRDLALAAHSGTSFVPEDRASQEQADYAQTLRQDYEALKRHAPTPEKLAVLDAEFARYRAGYAEKTRRYLASRSRVVSWMIAGPSKFPVRRMEKRNAVVDRRLSELVEFRERAVAAIRRTLHPELRPIMSGDADAQARLAEKIKKAEELQERMKAANAAIRKNQKAGPEAQVAALGGLGFPDGIARKLIEPDYLGRVGFPDYEIRNQNANIRRLKGRLSGVERNQALPATESEGVSAKLEDSPAENRIRIFFPGKPEAAVRETLKRGGFRWAPHSGCWQAYRNPGSIALARKVAGVDEGKDEA